MVYSGPLIRILRVEHIVDLSDHHFLFARIRLAFFLTHASMSTSQDQEANKNLSRKLRTACDICHQAKMKCSGGTPCQGCRGSDHECIYSVSKRIGRPKGTKNKRTADRISRQQSEKERKTHRNEYEGRVSVSTPSPDQISRVNPQPLAFDSGTGQSPATISNASIDTLLERASNIPYSLPGSEGRGLFADSTNRWYDFGELAQTSPLKVSIAWQPFVLWLWQVATSSCDKHNVDRTLL